jgi:hypothetical protein
MTLPIDWAAEVLAEHATEDELDEEMTTLCWEWGGAEEEEEDDEMMSISDEEWFGPEGS